MLTKYDYIVLVFYFLFMFLIGYLMKNMSKNSSDYFRGGGSMVWWMVGATAFMTQFSAWTFTGAAGKAYMDGPVVAVIFFGNVLGYLVNFAWSSEKFRAMRRSTPLEAVRDRFGPKNEQVFTWLQLPIGFFYAAIWLNGLAIFSSEAFGLEQSLTIWIVGITVVFISVSGGAWAVIASDFVQLVLLMSVAVLMFFLTLGDSRIDGMSGLIEKAPDRFFDWSAGTNLNILILWIVATMIAQIVKTNSILDSYRYLCAKDGKHAKYAALFAAILMFIGPVIWFTPAIAAYIIEPNLGEVFVNLKKPQEGAYIFMASQILPVGMLGLLVCGVFAATMSSMDSGLNRNAGIFVNSFYNPILRPKAEDKELLFVGKLSSVFFGLMIVIIAQIINANAELDLFNIMVLFGSLVAIPYAMPLVLGIIVKRVPPWAAWSTVIVGFTASIFIEGLQLWGINVARLDPATLGFNLTTTRELNDFRVIASAFGNITICSVWFLGSALFYRFSSESYKKRADDFFTKINTPVDFKKEIGQATDFRQGILLSKMLYLYGGFIALLSIFFPNTIGGRLCFVGVGALMAGIGGLLHYSAIRFQKMEALEMALEEEKTEPKEWDN